MDFEDACTYTYSQIAKKVKEYEKSENMLLTERKTKNENKSSFKLVCAKAVKTSCPFRLTFSFNENLYEFKKKSSVLRHNHCKLSKKTFQTQFFKRDFKEIEAPLKRLLESGWDNIKPKVLLKYLKEENMMTPNIQKGFTLYHKTFKKKFDNLVRKVKESIKIDISNSTATSGNSPTYEDNALIFKEEVKVEPFIEDNTVFKAPEIKFEDKKNEGDIDKYLDLNENSNWFIPFTFY